MKNPFEDLLRQLKSASLAAKLALGAGLLALAGVVAVATTWADKPNFVLLAGNLDARSSASIQSALAGAGVRFQATPPPGPFSVHVDEEQFYQAQNAIALAGALDAPATGIRTDQSGATSVFLSASERAQSSLKREWQEMESQLEALDFVERARVSTSTPDRSPLRRGQPMTVAVTLTLRGRADLSRSQAATVAKLVRHRFNVPSECVMVSDQSGRALWNAVKEDDSTTAAGDLLDHQQRHDHDLEAKANEVLDSVFGPGLARVVVVSQWTQEEVESVKETIDPKNKVVVSETSTKTSTPQESSTASADPAQPAPQAAVAETSESQKSTVVGRETSLRRASAPRLERMSVSMFLDESQKDRAAGLEAAVKGATGFDEKRGDAFSSFVSPFAGVQRDEQGKPLPPAPMAPIEEPNPMVEMLVERSVEIVAALVFLFVMFRALKGVAARKPGVDAMASTAKEDEEMLELLARGSVEELIKNEPERVGAVLSRWAAEDKAAAKAGAR